MRTKKLFTGGLALSSLGVAIVGTGMGCGDGGTTSTVEPEPEPLCTTVTIVGRYGLLASGTSGDSPYVAGGVLTIKDGSFEVDARQSLDGELADVSPSTGTVTVTGDCKGALSTAEGEPAYAFTIVGEGDELRFIDTTEGNVITGSAKKMAEGCTTDNIAGEYGYAINAIVYLDVPGFPEGPSPFAGSGLVTVDDAGGLALGDVASIRGLVLNRSYDGDVTVDDGCVGSAVVTLPDTAPTSNNPVNVDVFWVDNREEAFIIQKDTGTFIAGPARRREVSTCKDSDILGRYGFIANGTTGAVPAEGGGGGTPYVAGGVMEFAEGGALTITGTQSVDGEVGPVAIGTGSYTLDGCVLTVNDEDDELLYSMSIVADGSEIRFIRGDAGQVITGYAKRVADNCTQESVAGSYGYAINAIVYLDVDGFPKGASPFAGAGVVDLSTGGKLDLVDTASIGGKIFPRSYSGAATLADDCTGTASVTLPETAPTSNNPVNVELVWVDEGREALIMQRDAGTFIAGAAQRRTVLDK